MKSLSKILTGVALVLIGGCSLSVGDKHLPNGNVVAPFSGTTAAVKASDWLGVNADTDLPYVDAARYLNGFNVPVAQQDAKGYPIAGVSGTSSTDLGFLLPTGTYRISYQGTGSVSVSGIGSLTGVWQTVGNEQRNVVQIKNTPGVFGQFLNVTITNQTGQTVTDLHLFMPGVPYGTTDLFAANYLKLLAPFRTLRFMSWMGTNNSTATNWSDRSSADHFGQPAFGIPYENIIALINATGKDLWINIPEKATDDFVKQFADLFRDNLDFEHIDDLRRQQGVTAPFEIVLEYSNETWNGGFSAYKTLLAAAQLNPSRYDGAYHGTLGPSWMSNISDLMKVGQYEADRLVQCATIFRNEFSTIGKADLISPVLSGWAIGAAYSEVALEFIQDHMGDPADYIKYIAIAPYFGPADDGQTVSLDRLFASMDVGIANYASLFSDFKKLGQQYNLEIASYEGGQGIAGNTNVHIKHLAQQDIRMHDAYLTFFALWKKYFGHSLYMQFTLGGGLGVPEFVGQWGFWGSINTDLMDPDQCSKKMPKLTGTEDFYQFNWSCPKYQALREAAFN